MFRKGSMVTIRANHERILEAWQTSPRRENQKGVGGSQRSNKSGAAFQWRSPNPPQMSLSKEEEEETKEWPPPSPNHRHRILHRDFTPPGDMPSCLTGIAVECIALLCKGTNNIFRIKHVIPHVTDVLGTRGVGGDGPPT